MRVVTDTVSAIVGMLAAARRECAPSDPEFFRLKAAAFRAIAEVAEEVGGPGMADHAWQAVERAEARALELAQ